MSILRTAERSANLRTNGFKPRVSYRIPPIPAAPGFRGAGTAVGGTTGTISVGWPAGASIGDLAILVVEASGNSSDFNISGWNHFSGSPLVDLASTSGSKLSVMWRRVTSASEANVTVPATNDHTIASISVFSGVRGDINPGRSIVSGAKTTATATITWPSLDALAHNSEIIYVASRPDDNSSTTVFSLFANANLTDVGQASQAGTTNGNGGGFVVYYGTKTEPGGTGEATANLAAFLTNAYMVIGLEPSVAIPA
jgi:hypothetical protein